jgi:hypothetical protein
MLTETRFLHLRKQHSRTAVAAIALGHCGSLLECERGKIQRYVCGSTARELESLLCNRGAIVSLELFAPSALC